MSFRILPVLLSLSAVINPVTFSVFRYCYTRAAVSSLLCLINPHYTRTSSFSHFTSSFNWLILEIENEMFCWMMNHHLPRGEMQMMMCRLTVPNVSRAEIFFVCFFCNDDDNIQKRFFFWRYCLCGTRKCKYGERQLLLVWGKGIDF